MHKHIGAIVSFSLCLCAGSVLAKKPDPPPQSPVIVPIRAAANQDVASVDGIIAALYDVISGPVGQARDWNRMRSLFVPGGRLMAIESGRNSHMGMYVLSVNDYIAVSGELLVKSGFHERELARRSERFGHMVQVFSTYEGRGDKDFKPTRGINSIELMNDGTRWWIVSVLWEDERANNPLPAQYLPKP